MVDGDENLLAGKQDEQEVLAVWGETETGAEFFLQGRFLHDDAVEQTAVTLAVKWKCNNYKMNSECSQQNQKSIIIEAKTKFTGRSM